MPHLTRAENRATFLHVLNEIFSIDVEHPIALALDACDVTKVIDLLSMPTEMIALLTYGREVMPLQAEYKDILEWFTKWSYALYLANHSMPLSAVAWRSMTAADFDDYRTSLGTSTPIIHAAPLSQIQDRTIRVTDQKSHMPATLVALRS